MSIFCMYLRPHFKLIPGVKFYVRCKCSFLERNSSNAIYVPVLFCVCVCMYVGVCGGGGEINIK